MRKLNQGQDESVVDMTPMLDIVFILLIFFIVTASFMKETGVSVHSLSKAPVDPNVDPAVAFAVQISADNRITIKGREVELASVSAYLESVKAEMPDFNVVVLASDESDAKTLVAVVDAIRLTGIDSVPVGRLD